jgi:transcriptional regulator with XRE-family HTH domain
MTPKGNGTAVSPLYLPISVRAFAKEVDLETETDTQDDGGAGKSSRNVGGLDAPTDWTFTFDTETTVDPTQRFRVGFYRLHDGDRLIEERLFIDAAALSAGEVRVAALYCRRRGLPPPITLEVFRMALLKAIAIGAMIVTFNGPFDIARVAKDASPARANKWRRKMQDGFSFRLSDDPFQPCIQIKSLNSSAAVVELTAPRRQDTGRSQRKKKDATPTHRGFFTDVKTLAKALTSRVHSLESLTEALKTPKQKIGSQEHGAPLSFGYLDYARDDVAATWECYVSLKRKYDTYGLRTPAHEIVSEAGIGKAALATIGIQPWLKVQPGPFDPALVSLIMSTYYGGRTEVRLRREKVRVLHTDFTSMYPTVCTAQGLWRFVIGEGFTHRDGTAEVRAFLEAATPELFQDLANWPKLAALVRVTPDYDLFPIRAPFGTASPQKKSRRKAPPPSATIGLNYLKADRPMWFTFADCLVAKFLYGKTPKIEQALIFEPGPPQRGLEQIKVLGRHTIDPYKQDFYRELIRARQKEEAAKEGKSDEEQARIEEVREGIKTVANSTSYGIFVQVNVNRAPKKAMVRVFKPDGSFYLKRIAKVETLGPWFNPIVATLITGGARLMLALAEYKIEKSGLDWAFCDTDSMAIAKPIGLDDADFEARALGVVEWFRPLNPYGFDEPILKIEKVNYAVDDTTRIEPLFCWAISSKRYALFNVDGRNRPIIRKASAHGLGHLISPYEKANAPTCFPLPLPAVLSGKEKLQRWHYDVWCSILEAVLRGDPDSVTFNYHPPLNNPTVSRYTATTPDLLAWFKLWNKDKAYADQIKPHNFLFALHKKRFAKDEIPDPIEGHSHDGEIRPVAPFDRDLKKSIAQAFDRVTGRPVKASDLEPYTEALFDYPYRSEAKFLNGDTFDTGRTERLYVQTSEVRYIGKEADRWEEEYYLGLRSGELAVDYGGDPVKGGQAFVLLRNAIAAFGLSNVATVTGISRATLSKIERGKAATTHVPLDPVITAIAELNRGRSVRERECDAERARFQALRLQYGGVRKAARAIGMDPSNFSKRLKGLR